MKAKGYSNYSYTLKGPDLPIQFLSCYLFTVCCIMFIFSAGPVTFQATHLASIAQALFSKIRQ
jgi:hypothetical protein